MKKLTPSQEWAYHFLETGGTIFGARAMMHPNWGGDWPSMRAVRELIKKGYVTADKDFGLVLTDKPVIRATDSHA